MSLRQTVKELQEEQQQLDFRKDEFLRAEGWESTPKTTGAFTVVHWMREHKGQTFTVHSNNTALQLQMYFDHELAEDPVLLKVES